jgi:MEMO1 family protein
MPPRRAVTLVMTLVLIGVPMTAKKVFGQTDEKTRPAVCAGSWYPGDRVSLASEVDRLLAQAKPPALDGRPRAIIAPHAGYRYSAPTAAAAYACLREQSYKRVIVLAFSHREAGSYQGVDVPKDLTAYATPLGDVPLDREFCNKLLKTPLFAAHPGVGAAEHSLELQLPFLQRTLKEFKLVPLLVGQMDDAQCARLAQAIVPLLDDDTLLVVSSDFTHYGANFRYLPFRDNVPEKLRELADNAARPIERCDYDGFDKHLNDTQDTICGREPILLLLRILSMQGGAKAVRAAFDTSGSMTDDWSSSVTYQSFVFTHAPGTLKAAEREELLRLARLTVTRHLRGDGPPEVDAAQLGAGARRDGACFVTLTNRGDLRGCIGNMEARGPLYQAVIDNAIAACKDYRFADHPVTTDEVKDLHIEISYLTPMREVKNIEEIVIGRHGLLISRHGQRGVLLPQVAYERGWTRAEFLAQTCRKAGLPPDAWKDSAATIQSFEAEVFGETEP